MSVPRLGKLPFLSPRCRGPEEEAKHEQTAAAAYGAAEQTAGAAKQAAAGANQAAYAPKDVPLPEQMLEPEMPVHT